MGVGFRLRLRVRGRVRVGGRARGRARVGGRVRVRASWPTLRRAHTSYAPRSWGTKAVISE